MSDRAAVRNAADPDQVKRAGRKEKERVDQERAWFKDVMSTPSGRAVMWTLLERAGVFRSVWSPSAAIHYNAGKQDYGHELMAVLIDVDEDAYELMMREARARARRENVSTDAAHTPRAEDQGVSNGR